MSLAGIPSGSFRPLRLDCGPMKTQILLSSLFISSALIITACTPRDVKLSPDGSVRTNGGRNGKNSPGGSASFNLKSSFSLAAFLGERQIEAIQFVKVASETLDAGNNKFSIEKKERKEDGSSHIVLNTNVKDFKYEGPDGVVKTGVSRKVNVNLLIVEGSGLERLSASAAKDCEFRGKVSDCVMRSNADAADKQKYYVNLQETVYNIEVQPGDSAGQLKINFVTEGQIVGSKSAAEKNSSQKIKMNMNLVVDRASLNTSKVQILSSKVSFDYPNQNDSSKPAWFVKMDAQNQAVILDPACDRLNGVATFISDPKKPATTIVFDDQSISIQGKDWVKPLAECGQRPVVDLSRLQVY